MRSTALSATSAKGSWTALLGLWLWLAASSCVAPATSVCVKGTDCPSGVCLAGVCAPTATEPDSSLGRGDLSGPGGHDALDAAADTTKVCVENLDCTAMNGPCVVGTCQSGECVVAPLPNDVTCFTANKCPVKGSCAQGVCLANPGAKACDDGQPCTTDNCSDQGCQNDKVADNVPCEADEVLDCQTGVCKNFTCNLSLKAGSCLIDGACVQAGAVQPGKPCSRCEPAVSTTSWTSVSTGSCDDGDACTADDKCIGGGQCEGMPVNCPASGPCLTASCDSKTGCSTVPQEGPCSDGNPCTTNDACTGGACKGGPALDCDDGQPCTEDSCVTGIGCYHEPLSGPGSPPCIADSDPCTQDICEGGVCVGKNLSTFCKIGAICVPAQAVADGNPCLKCDPSKSTTDWTKLDDVACDDGNACTLFTNCVQGKCEGQPASCDDKSLCTSDTCDPKKGCAYQPKPGPCNDGNLCTSDDACALGKCAGKPLAAATCDDLNPCTTDLCDPTFGCTHKPNNNPCSDNDPCTKGDQCSANKCVSGLMVCPCLTDAECDDGNPCTKNLCLSAGCSNDLLTGPACNDGDACTKSDACAAGWCEGIKVPCNDNNPCTLDSCVAEAGCVAQALDVTACNDGNACTIGDVCLAGKCAGTPKFCDDGNACTLDTCDIKTGNCEHSLFGSGTACPDDGLGCTIDQCLGGVCDHSVIKSDMCLIQGTCLSGGAVQPADPCQGCLPKVSQAVWSMRNGLPCNDNNACTSGDLCSATGKCGGTKLVCSDGEICTLDSCDPSNASAPCFSVPMAGACNDGNPCTSPDSCNSLGKCSGVATNCDDADPCTLDSCGVPSGCLHVAAANGGGCGSDGLECTLDQCQEGVCSHPVAADWCKIAGTCKKAGEFAPSPACQTCQPLLNNSAWSPANGGTCDDGNPCTVGDSCAAGVCKPSPTSPCDDGNPCTTDTCSPTAGCTHVALSGQACDDGNSCTQGDKCSAGACAGSAVTCASAPGDAAACLLALCDPKVGCAKVTTCPYLHECIGGTCLTASAGAPGPVAIPLATLGLTKLTAPTVRWQATGESWLGPTARLWVAGQTSPCTAGTNQGQVVALQLTAGGQLPTSQTLSTAGVGSCQTHAQLLAHPASFARTLLAWLDIDNKSCTFGSLRLAALGASAPVVGPPTACLPVPGGRPGLAVSSADTSTPVGAMATLVRAAGPAAWQGDGAYPDALLSNGAALPAAGPPVQPAKVTFGRPAAVAIQGGRAELAPVRFDPAVAGDFDPYASLQMSISLDTPGKPLPVVVASGLDVLATNITYLGVDAAWDADAARLLVLISGTATQGGKLKGFLAYCRFSPDITAPAVPTVATWFDPPGSGEAGIDTFRIAEIPGLTDFLMAWALPGSAQLWLARVKAVNDKKFITQVSQTVATDFAPAGVMPATQSNGGLSEIAISPSADRYTLVYQTADGLGILTAPMPK